jgi:hypothetical protein
MRHLSPPVKKYLTEIPVLNHFRTETSQGVEFSSGVSGWTLNRKKEIE